MKNRVVREKDNRWASVEWKLMYKGKNCCEECNKSYCIQASSQNGDNLRAAHDDTWTYVSQDVAHCPYCGCQQLSVKEPLECYWTSVEYRSGIVVTDGYLQSKLFKRAVDAFLETENLEDMDRDELIALIETVKEHNRSAAQLIRAGAESTIISAIGHSASKIEAEELLKQDSTCWRRVLPGTFLYKNRLYVEKQSTQIDMVPPDDMSDVRALFPELEAVREASKGAPISLCSTDLKGDPMWRLLVEVLQSLK